jgi:hypothetical protein
VRKREKKVKGKVTKLFTIKELNGIKQLDNCNDTAPFH